MSPPPSPRQPIVKIPPSIALLVGVMAVIQLVSDQLPDRLDAEMLARFAFVPGRFTYAVAPARVVGQFAQADLDTAAGRQAFAIGRFFLGDGAPEPWTALTYALLHGGWVHLGLNTLWLLAFGVPLARRLGTARILLFLAMGALAGAAAHLAVAPLSLQPLVGASAAVSACMGAALRFLFQPAARLWPAEADATAAMRAAPRLPLRAVLRDGRARAFLIVWFLSNMVTGIGAVSFGLSDAPVAWQAHIGGFLAGLLAFPLFDPRGPPAADPEQVAA